MKKILLDTNFLIDLGRFGVSIDEIDRLINERHELAVLRSVVNELKTIAGGQQQESKFAKLALMLIDLRAVKIIESENRADDAVIELATKDKDVIVATNDVELKKKLKDLGVRTICLRSKKHLVIDY
jgi:hypothetical protein